MSEFTSPMKPYLKAEALSYVRSGKYAEAANKYQQYIELNEHDDDAWAALGGAFRRLGDLQSAINSYEKAFQINPRSTYAAVNLVSLLFALKPDGKKLQDYVSRALALTEDKIRSGTKTADHWTWYDLGMLQLIKGDVDAATRSYNYAAEITPQTATEHFRSAIDGLTFLKDHNPTIKSIDRIIDLLTGRIKRATDVS